MILLTVILVLSILIIYILFNRPILNENFEGINNYLVLIKPKLYSSKLGRDVSKYNILFNRFSELYQENIYDYDNNLDKLCLKANIYLKELYKKLDVKPEHLKWNIKYFNKIENEMPFTYDETIYIPKKILNQSEQTIVKILVHEKIHILQRFYPEYFENVYMLKFPFFIKEYNPFTDNYFLNPDGLDMDWAIKDDDELKYYPVFEVINGKSIYSFYNNDKQYSIDQLKIVKRLGLKDGWNHPNELYAYIFSNDKNNQLIQI